MDKKEIKKSIEKLKENYPDGAITAYIELYGEEFIDNFEEFYQGEWESDEDFVKDLTIECGDIPKNLPSYIHIDWEKTTRNIMMDYSENNGYYFRN